MKKKAIHVRIPEDLYNKIENSEYKTTTDCVIAALTKLFEEFYMKNENNSNTINLHIQDLQEQLQISNKRYDDLQMTYQAYMIQIQSFFEQKKIEEPKEKRWYEFWK